MIRILVAGCVLLLAGCATCYHRADQTAGDFGRDRKECEAKVHEQGGSTFSFNGRNKAMEECMKERGWEAEHG